MTHRKYPPTYTAEFRERGIRLYNENRSNYPSDNAAYKAIAFDNALAESTIGLFKTEDINFLGPWKTKAQLEWETLKWVSWYNTERLHSAIRYITPQEAEKAFYANMNSFDKVA